MTASGEHAQRCEWPIAAAGPRHGEPCGARAWSTVAFRIDRNKPGGRRLARHVCARHEGVARRVGWHYVAGSASDIGGPSDG